MCVCRVHVHWISCNVPWYDLRLCMYLWICIIYKRWLYCRANDFFFLRVINCSSNKNVYVHTIFVHRMPLPRICVDRAFTTVWIRHVLRNTRHLTRVHDFHADTLAQKLARLVIDAYANGDSIHADHCVMLQGSHVHDATLFRRWHTLLVRWKLQMDRTQSIFSAAPTCTAMCLVMNSDVLLDNLLCFKCVRIYFCWFINIFIMWWSVRFISVSESVVYSCSVSHET